MGDIVCDEVDGWTPARDGDVYCAPRCGMRCKWADYVSACNQANALCETLGADWRPRVWENLGWHYTARRGRAEVFYHKRTGDYTLDVDTDVKQYLVEGPTPTKLLIAGAATIRADIARLERALAVIEDGMARVRLGAAANIPAAHAGRDA